MREDDLWRYQQYLRRLQECLLDLNVVWNDNAAREISIRYLHPQEEDAQHLNQHLMALKRSISKAEEQMLTVRTEAPEASRLSEQIAELAGDFYVEEKTSYEHVELSVQSRAHAASLFNLVQHFIEKANASCTNVGGGSAGESIWMATRDADKINSKSILLNTSMKSLTTTVVEVTDESDKKTILSSMSTEGIETQSIVVKVANNDKNIFSIDHLEPNMNYTENGYIFTTNNESQVSRIQGRLQLQTASRNKPLQKKVGESSGVENDEGGHYIATRFNGPTELYNLFPQNMNLNRGQWKAMENKWRNLLEEGYQIDVDIRPVRINDNDVRPFGFDVYYTIHTNGRFSKKVADFL